jgi:thiamine pyrophosphokinase
MPAEERAQHDTVIVVAGGGPPLRDVLLPRGAAVVAADGGLELALALGLRVDVAVGDFDSVSSEALAEAETAGTRIERHPQAKDATDLELALQVAAALDPKRILVIGAEGGRLDHLIAGLLALGSERYAGFEVDAILGDTTTIHVVRGERRLAGEPGGLLTLLAVNGPAVGVVTEGLVYPLRGETLEPGSTRGVSNVFSAADARVRLERGVLLAIRPGSDLAPASELGA